MLRYPFGASLNSQNSAYYMASHASWQHEANSASWLVIRAGTMSLSCAHGIFHFKCAGKPYSWPYNKSLSIKYFLYVRMPYGNFDRLDSLAEWLSRLIRNCKLPWWVRSKFRGHSAAGGVFSYTEIFRSSKRNILIKCQKHNLRKSLVSYYKLKSSERIGRAELLSRLY